MLLRKLEWTVTRWMERNGHALLRLGIGVVFVWFGAPKLVPGLSPADELVARTLPWFDRAWVLPTLGAVELAIGLCFLVRPLLAVGLVLMAGHMLGTALPLFMLPEVAWKAFPIATLEGQYILKNLVLVGGAIVLGGGYAREARRRSRSSVRWVARRVATEPVEPDAA